MAGLKRRTDFFEVNVSPRPKKSRDSDPPAILTLAPFTCVPKVCLNNVKVNSTASTTVVLNNPSDLPVEVQLDVSNDLKKLGLEFNSLHLNIPAGSTSSVEIHWAPKKSIHGRGKIVLKHLNGDKRFSYISVNCSSVEEPSKKPKTKSAQRPSSLQKMSSKPKVYKPVTFTPSFTPTQNGFLTPNRRVTYGVAQPTFRTPGATPTVTPHCFRPPTAATFSSDEDNKRNLWTQPCFNSNRTPLKEYNYNTLPSPRVKKEDSFFEEEKEEEKRETKHELKIIDRSIESIFEETDLSFDRDSLESSDRNLIFDIPSFSLSRNSDLHVKSEKSFYSSCGLELSFETTPFYLDPNMTLSSTTQNQGSESVRENCYPVIKAEAACHDATYSIIETSSHTPPKVAVCHPETSPCSCEPNEKQQAVSFVISPARPIFRRTNEKVRFKKEFIVKKNPESRPVSREKDGFFVFNAVKEDISLFNEPDYLLHPYGVTNIADPFSRHGAHPREWLEKLEFELIKWMNSLLRPPVELGNLLEGVDVKKLWDQSTVSALQIAPSREAASKDYVLSDGNRLTALRKVAASLSQSDEFRQTIYNIRGKIDSGFLCVKDDINLYRNQGARVKLVQMCMFYNPLWLRIALEVLFGQCIPLNENNIHQGLVYFLKNKLLSEQDIVGKHKNVKSANPLGPNFIVEMNNYIVLKFLTLVYFLDLAKLKKIMPYDPCLFCKTSPIKESEGMLNEFIKEFLKCVGQFKKTLKALGYKLEFHQTFLDEFDYGLSSHLDLRDGVRLTRMMETILKDPSYSSKLLTPTVSRTQKLHNVQVALSALEQNGYSISCGISPGDIVNGHREKIYSLLWQILHGFLAPRYQSSSVKIQRWWRRHYLKFYINKRISMKKHVVKVQAHVRGFLVRKKINKLHSSTKKIQRWFKENKNRSMTSERAVFIEKRKAAINIQKWFRSILLSRQERARFLMLKKSAVIIQTHYRNHALMKYCRVEFLRKKDAALKMQKWYRNLILCRQERSRFILQRNCAIQIQLWFRSNQLMRTERYAFVRKQKAAIKIQKWYRNLLDSKKVRNEFLRCKKAACIIQRFYRNQLVCISLRLQFLSIRKSVILIQRYYKGYLLMKSVRGSFLKKKSAVVTIQRWYKRVVLCRADRKKFLSLRKAAVTIQHAFRSRLELIKQNRELLLREKAAIKIQTLVRGYLTRKKFKHMIKRLSKTRVTSAEKKKSCENLLLAVRFNNSLPVFINPKRSPKDVGELYLSYKEIDLCVRFSPVLCLELTNYDYFFYNIWTDLNQGMRGGPHVDIFRHGLSIILKLSKYNETAGYLVNSMDTFDGYSVLVSLMGKFLDKNTDVFCRAATVIWILLTGERKIHVLERLDVARLKFFHKKILDKAKKGKQHSKEIFPSQRVDWGYFEKNLEFTNIRAAIQEIRKLL